MVSGASAPSRSVLDGSGCFGGPGPGQQFAEAAVWPVIDELGQHVSQVGMRIDAMQFAGLDQRGEHGPVFCPFVRTSKSAFFLLRATGRMLRSTVLESISMRPSSRKR